MYSFPKFDSNTDMNRQSNPKVKENIWQKKKELYLKSSYVVDIIQTNPKL